MGCNDPRNGGFLAKVPTGPAPYGDPAFAEPGFVPQTMLFEGAGFRVIAIDQSIISDWHQIRTGAGQAVKVLAGGNVANFLQHAFPLPGLAEIGLPLGNTQWYSYPFRELWMQTNIPNASPLILAIFAHPYREGCCETAIVVVPTPLPVDLVRQEFTTADALQLSRTILLQHETGIAVLAGATVVGPATTGMRVDSTGGQSDVIGAQVFRWPKIHVAVAQDGLGGTLEFYGADNALPMTRFAVIPITASLDLQAFTIDMPAISEMRMDFINGVNPQAALYIEMEVSKD